MLCRQNQNPVTVEAPAKLNLFLKVLGKRADGFHELETLMLSVDWYDSLRASLAEDGELSLRCFDALPHRPKAQRRELPPVDSGNLVIRAAELLRHETGATLGARLELFKRIPMAAGLAGGSSDAAATLLALNRLWKLALPREELQSLAARLGSDISFFLCNSTAAVCRGRGEIVEPRPLNTRLHFVIARPLSGLSTAEVFRHCHPSQTPATAEQLAEALARGRSDHAASLFHNALQEPAERLNADVTRLKAWFARQPFTGHLMSGSGSSYFGLCRSRHQAQQLAARLRAARFGDVFVASSRP